VTRLFGLYALSGFLSLAYQVAWFRIVTDWFGSSSYTFVLVVANFIGGLALGASLSRRTTAFLVRRTGLIAGLRVYGLVELLVAASIGLTFVAAAIPADLWGSFPYQERDGIWVPAYGYRIFQAATAGVCVLVPCFFMGVTFPLLCDRFRGHPGIERFPAALYASNSLGACIGVLACQFVLLPWLGHNATLGWMAAANALLGGYFLVTRADFGLTEALPGAISVEPGPKHSTPSTPLSTPLAPSGAAAPGALLLLVSVGGFLAGAMEGDLFRRIGFVIELNPTATMSFISFWATLAIFLASAAVHRLSWLRLPTIRVCFALAAVYGLMCWQYVDAIRDWVESNVLPVPVDIERSLEGLRNLGFPTSLTQLLVFTGILILPPYFLASTLLPYACNRLQAERRHVGLAYALNTLAFCAGLLTFVLIAPRVNLFYSLKLFPVVLAVSAAWLFALPDTRPVVAWKPTVLVGALMIAVLVVPADFDRSFFRKGSFPATLPSRGLRSNGAHTTFIVDVAGAPRLFFGRLQMSATNLRAHTYMRLMAHFPLLLSPDPKKALLICLGVGNTGSAIASHSGIRQIDVVDLNATIFETAADLASVNRNLHQDPRVRFIVDDGRNFLNVTDERYDLITSEPPPPLAAQVYRLYSSEYYQDVLEHLTPDGFMTQWLPVFLMTPEAVEMAVSTFLEVFPHSFLFSGFATDFILIGSPSPIDVGSLARRFPTSGPVKDELEVFNIQSPVDLLARIVQTDSALRRNYRAGSLISDQHNGLERQLPSPLARPVVAFDPADVLAYLGPRVPDAYAQLEGILTHLGRLRYHVQGYPFETLAAVDPTASPEVELAGLDWLSVAGLARENATHLRNGRRDLALRALAAALELSREQPEILMQLVRMRLQWGQDEMAIPLLREFQALEPGDYAGRQLLADAYWRTGQPALALVHYREAARSRPDLYQPLAQMAWIRATHPDPELRDPVRAIRLAEQAGQRVTDDSLRVPEVLAAAYASAGDFPRAAGVLERAIDRLPPDRGEDRERLESQLEGYRAGRPLVDDSIEATSLGAASSTRRPGKR
jgi:spermidine synthase